MTTPLSNQIIREITPLSDKDCFYIAERYKTEFTYPIPVSYTHLDVYKRQAQSNYS